jgi:predicted ABC-type ATPase
VSEEVIRRRYKAGLRNFFEIYAPLANAWKFYDNSAYASPELIAEKPKNGLIVYKEDLWLTLQKQK